MGRENGAVERPGRAGEVEVLDLVGVDEDHLSTLAAVHVGVCGGSRCREELVMIFAMYLTGERVSAERAEFVADDRGLFLELTSGRSERRLQGLDRATDQTPAVRIDWRVVVALAPYANPYLANAGFLTVAATVRPSSTAMWPAQLHDTRRVLAWLQRNPLGLPIDPTRIGIWGQSAGAHVAAMLALTEPATARRISAVVAISCPTDLNDPDWTAARTPDSPVTQLLGGARLATDAARRAASPAAHVAPGGPPFLLVHGIADETVPFSQAEKFAQALTRAGVRYELDVIHGGHHNLHPDPDAVYGGDVWSDVAARASTFFKRAFAAQA